MFQWEEENWNVSELGDPRSMSWQPQAPFVVLDKQFCLFVSSAKRGWMLVPRAGRRSSMPSRLRRDPGVCFLLALAGGETRFIWTWMFSEGSLGSFLNPSTSTRQELPPSFDTLFADDRNEL